MNGGARETVKTSARKILIRGSESGFRDFIERRDAWNADGELGRVRRNTLTHLGHAACPVIFLFLLYSVRRIPVNPLRLAPNWIRRDPEEWFVLSATLGRRHEKRSQVRPTLIFYGRSHYEERRCQWEAYRTRGEVVWIIRILTKILPSNENTPECRAIARGNSLIKTKTSRELAIVSCFLL